MSGNADEPSVSAGEENNLQALVTAARRHHRAGNLPEAERIYRQILADHPGHAEVLHLLGVAAHQSARHEEAVEFIAKAIQRDPDNPQFFLNLGSANLALSRTGEAVECYQKALEIDPDSADAYFNLGLAHTGRGKLDQAIACYRRSAEIEPGSADTHQNLGMVHLQQGNLNEAAICFQRCLEIQPDVEEAHYLLGTVLQRLDRPDEAVASYRRAITINPGRLSAHFNLGNALKEQGRPNEAAAGYRRVLELDPNHALAHHNLGLIHYEQGDLDAAFACLRRALEIEPDVAEWHFHLGTMYHDQDKLRGAIISYQRALEIDPDNAKGHFVLGEVQKKAGNHQEAVGAYERCLQLEPGNLRAKWNALLTLPVMYGSEAEIEHARHRWEAGIEQFGQELDLRSPEAIDAAKEVITSYTNFYLHYQGRNDLHLQSLYGSLIHRIASAAYPDFSRPMEKRNIPDGGRIRVGFVSSNFHDTHTVHKLFGPWVERLDRDIFEVHFFYTGKKSERETANLRRSADFFHDGRCSDTALIDTIRSKCLDVLIYTDIGMSPRIQVLAALRLAPVQCSAWGHPVTSGLPTIDFFLSSELMEPEDGDDHYSESLIRLPNLSICYTPPDPQPAHLGDHGRDADPHGPAYLCSQSLFKLLPQHDEIYPRIALKVGKCKFWFIQYSSQHVTDYFYNRLDRAFKAHGMNVGDYCTIFPKLSLAEFLSLNRKADILLDSIMWSGGNTTLEALFCDTPVVTMPGPMMRGRHSYAMLKMMGIDETIARDIDEYIDIAAGLGADIAWRNNIVRQINNNKHLMYNDSQSVDGLQQFIISQCELGPNPAAA